MADKAGRITVIGAGTIGPAVAYALMLKELTAEILLINRDEIKGSAKAADLSHCGPLTGGIRVSHGDYRASANSDIIVVTAGVLADKNGTRMDVMRSNVSMFRDMIPQIAHYSPEAVIIIVTNPLDVMTYAAYRLSGFPSARVIGTGTLLDTMRLKQIIGSRYGIDTSIIEAEVIGEHGESMVPVWSRIKVGGVALEDYLKAEGKSLSDAVKSQISRDTERAGWNIRLGNVHSCYGIALSAVKIIECMLGHSQESVTASTLLNGEYGIKDVFLSVPVHLGRQGVERIDIIDLSSEEKQLLAKSSGILSGYVKEAENIL